MPAHRIPIVVKVWAGDEPHDFEYISRSLPSLLNSDLPTGSELIVFDDQSTDPRTLAFLSDLERRDPRVRVIRHETNKGPNLGQQDAFRLVAHEYRDSPYFVNVDDDVIYHRHWLRHCVSGLDALHRSGTDGVVSALNMPFRTSHGRIAVDGFEFLLKRKQPALNWVIPRSIYEAIGEFTDEGVAYDTVYSHYMQLRGYCFYCMRPSYVQNIGLLGAYATDRRTTSDDFVGPGDGYPVWQRWGNRAAFWAFWAKFRLQSLRENPLSIVWPIRWGTDWIYEADSGQGPRTVMLCGSQVDAQARYREVRGCQPEGPFALEQLRTDRQGAPLAFEFGWDFSANLTQTEHLREPLDLDPRTILREVLEDLSCFHRSGVVHDKVRPENVYWDRASGRWRLAWYGREAAALPAGWPESGTDWAAWSLALDNRAADTLREAAATSLVGPVAPELLEGAPPTTRRDLFALGVTLVASLDSGVAPRTLSQWGEMRAACRRGTLPEALAGDQSLCVALRAMLASEPEQRPADASQALALLGPG